MEEKNIEIYDLYCEKIRNLSYLQSELNKLKIIEYEKEMKTKKRLKSVQQKLRQQELGLLTNNHDDGVETVDDLDILDQFGPSHSGSVRRSNRNRDTKSFTESQSITNTNTNTNTVSNSSSGSSTMASSTVSASPTHQQDDDSIGSISDIDDQHMQF